MHGSMNQNSKYSSTLNATIRANLITLWTVQLINIWGRLQGYYHFLLLNMAEWMKRKASIIYIQTPFSKIKIIDCAFHSFFEEIDKIFRSYYIHVCILFCQMYPVLPSVTQVHLEYPQEKCVFILEKSLLHLWYIYYVIQSLGYLSQPQDWSQGVRWWYKLQPQPQREIIVHVINWLGSLRTHISSWEGSPLSNCAVVQLHKNVPYQGRIIMW